MYINYIFGVYNLYKLEKLVFYLHIEQKYSYNNKKKNKRN